MTLLTIKLKAIQAALVEVLPATFHYWRPINNDRAPFIVWAENGENSRLDVNNFKDLQAIGGNIDFYTKKEFDPLVDDIQSRLQGLQFKSLLVGYWTQCSTRIAPGLFITRGRLRFKRWQI